MFAYAGTVAAFFAATAATLAVYAFTATAVSHTQHHNRQQQYYKGLFKFHTHNTKVRSFGLLARGQVSGDRSLTPTFIVGGVSFTILLLRHPVPIAIGIDAGSPTYKYPAPAGLNILNSEF
jgi:hypothetical protein